jgi:hypothetical protein
MMDARGDVPPSTNGREFSMDEDHVISMTLDEIEDAVLRQMYAIMHDETQFPDIRISAAHTILQTVKERRNRPPGMPTFREIAQKDGVI